MRDFVITTDSNSDLSHEYLKENNITIISHYYEIDGENYGEDNLLSDHEFYERMKKGSMPITMASNPAVIREIFTQKVTAGYDVLHISFSSALSCGCSNVTVGAAEIVEKYPESKIIVFDSLTVSLSQGIMIMKAVEMKKAGATIDEIAEWLNANVGRFKCFFTVDDLFHLHRGGRVSKTTAIVGTLINVKPILCTNPEGKLVPYGKVRGRKKSLISIVDSMIEEIKAGGPDRLPVGIPHGDCAEDAEFVADVIRKRFAEENLGTPEIVINVISPSIGAHSGPNALGLCFFA